MEPTELEKRQKRGSNNSKRSKNYERELAADLGVTRLDAIPGYAGQRRTDIRFKSDKLARTFDIEVKSRINANISALFGAAVEKCQFPNLPVLALILRKRQENNKLERYAVLKWGDFCELITADNKEQKNDRN